MLLFSLLDFIHNLIKKFPIVSTAETFCIQINISRKVSSMNFWKNYGWITGNIKINIQINVRKKIRPSNDTN